MNNQIGWKEAQRLKQAKASKPSRELIVAMLSILATVAWIAAISNFNQL